MTPEQLKASILYSALKGQLTEQFIGKEDAKKDYSNIKVSTVEDIPYDLPENWLWVELREVATNQNGYAFKPSDWLQSGTKIIRIQNLTDDNVPCNYCDESIVEDKYKIQNGDVLVSWSCTIDAFLYKGEDAVLNQHIFKIIFDKISIDKKFYIYAIKSLLRTINNRRHGSTMTHITKKDFEGLYFPLPPFEEQHRIVKKIEELLPYVDRYAEAYEKLEQFNAKFPEDMKKSILQYAIQGKLVEQRPEEGNAEDLYKQIQEEKQKLIKEGKIKKEKPLAVITEEEIPFEIPSSWKLVRLGYIAHKITDGTHKTPKYTEDGIKFISAKNLYNGDLDFSNCKYISHEEHEELYARCNPEKGDLLVSKSGSIGTVVIINVDFKFSTFESLALIKYNQKLLDARYLQYSLQNACNIINPEKIRGVAVKHLPIADLTEMIIPLPPLEEQHRIVAKIEELLPYCDQLIEKKL